MIIRESCRFIEVETGVEGMDIYRAWGSRKTTLEARTGSLHYGSPLDQPTLTSPMRQLKTVPPS